MLRPEFSSSRVGSALLALEFLGAACLLELHVGAQSAPAAMPEASVVIRAVGGGTLLLEPRTDLVIEIGIGSDEAKEFTVAFGTPPDARVEGLAERIRFEPGQRSQTLKCALVVEALRPAGDLRCELVLRGLGDGVVRKRAEIGFHAALGRDFLRLGFESESAPQRRRGAPRPRTTSRESGGITTRAGVVGAAGLALAPGSEKTLFAATSPADGAPLSRFPYLVFQARADAGVQAVLEVEAGLRKVVSSLPADSKWQRRILRLEDVLAPTLGLGPHVVTGLRIVVTGGAGSFEVDDLALCRDAESTAGDRLRDLCEKWVGARDQIDRDAVRAELLAIPETALAPEERVDHLLLTHALALEHALAGLPPKRSGEPVGEKRFAALLEHQQLLAESPSELIALGWTAVREHHERLQELAAKIAPGKSWREVVALLRSRHPNAEELPELSQQNWLAARDFTIAHDLVTVPLAARHGVVQPVTDGPLSRTYAFGGYGGARPSPEGFTGTFLVSPPAVWMDAKQAEERLRGNHYAWCRVVALHEMVPGHHLQTVVHEMRPLTAFRRLFHATLFAEGWALYCEQVLADAGYCDQDEVRFAWLQMRLWRAARVIMDCSLQTGRMSKQEAVTLFVQEAALLPENAEAEIARDVDVPTRPLSYFVGMLKIQDLENEVRKASGAAFSAKDFRDRLLSFGPVPVAAVRKGFGL